MKKPGILVYAWSLIVDQIFAILASLLVMNVINFFSSDGIPLLNFLICCSIYVVICYIDAWGRGCSDSNRMRLGVIPDNKLRGFYAGFIAAIPGFVLAFFAFLAETGIASFYNVFEFDIFTTIHRLWQLPLASLLKYANAFPFLNFVFPLFLPIVSGIAYLLGVYEITLKRIFIYKTEDSDDE